MGRQGVPGRYRLDHLKKKKKEKEKGGRGLPSENRGVFGGYAAFAL